MTLSEKYKKMQDEMTNAVQAAANQQVQATAMTPAQTAAAATAATELARQKGAGPQDYGTLADKYLNIYRNGQFNYDFNADPAWQNAKDAYMRQGQLAAKNVQAQAAALTGGYGNSYGAMAAQQQYNAALQNMNEIIPELEANVYNRYQADQNRNLTLAQMYMDLENQKYNRQMNEAQLAAQYGDYAGLNGLGIDTEKYESKEAADQAWEDLTRERTMTEWDQADEDRATNIALQAAQYGDYSKLEKLGFDMSTQRQRDALDEAIQKAQYSDYSGLKALGFDVAFLEAQKAAAWSKLYGTGSSGGGSGRRSGGSGGSGSGSDDVEDEPYVFDPTNLTDSERSLLKSAYSELGLTPRGVQTGGQYKGWVLCSGPDGTYYVRINEDGDIEVKP